MPKVETELDARLAELKAQREELDERRAKREADRAVLEAIAAEELALRDLEAVEKAECEHGALGVTTAAFYTRFGVVIVKRPNHVAFRKWQDTGKQTSDSMEALVRPCVVYPDKATFGKWMEEQPGALVLIADQVATLAGVKQREVSGK